MCVHKWQYVEASVQKVPHTIFFGEFQYEIMWPLLYRWPYICTHELAMTIDDAIYTKMPNRVRYFFLESYETLLVYTA